MAKVLVLYYSAYGHIEKMANAVAEGAREAGASVDIKKVPELVPLEVAKASHYKLDQPAPVAKGWLRVSHRELDPDLSRPYRPYHKHLRRHWLTPDELVEVQVEIWPTSMVFKKGHRIRLDIQPRDGIGSAPYTHYHADYNVGENTIYSGGEKESFLLVPIIPSN